MYKKALQVPSKGSFERVAARVTFRGGGGGVVAF